MVEMQPRLVPSTLMSPYESIASNVYNYRYNEPNVMYNEPLVTYNYYTFRGEMGVRVVQSPEMKGK